MEEGKYILIPLGFLQFIGILMLLASPIIIIWSRWIIALKVAGTGLILIVVSYILYKAAKEIIIKSIDDGAEVYKDNINEMIENHWMHKNTNK